MKQKFIEWFTKNNNGCSPAMEDDRSFVYEKTQLMFEAYQAGVAEGEARCAALAAENAGLKDALAAKDSTIATQQQEIRTLLNALEAAGKRIAELPGQKRLIGWRMADYTDETADPALAKNWANAVDVLPIFEGDVNTKLTAAAAGKGEAS
ncbi:Uncharacterised protein [Enterobacter ludwigii]|uniref:hypothetical protein n=1 Tax=Enterobacter TaxID=547 RepID=UPI000799352A|nr:MULTISPECIES: hypothetical protein [Enterobacter]SAG44863.1 Uncharacterised protein [Enterobacter ludwigii]